MHVCRFVAHATIGLPCLYSNKKLQYGVSPGPTTPTVHACCWGRSTSTRHCALLSPFWPARRQAGKAWASPVESVEASDVQQSQQQGSTPQPFKDPPSWLAFLGALFLSGATTGTVLDAIHSSVGLQAYDLAPVSFGPIHTSLLVPPLLGVFYIVIGLLTCIADNLLMNSYTEAAQERAQQGYQLAGCFTFLAINLYCSASLFNAQKPSWLIVLTLAVLAAANWSFFDRTKQGVGLALFCALGAPLSELLLMSLTHCWHYSRPDVAGVFVLWVPLCYFFYTPAVSNLARYLWRAFGQERASIEEQQQQ